YPDALDPARYIRSPALDLILQAIAHPHIPHFLILDEMNMSHVERYFSDILSAMESGEPVALHSAGAPGAIRDGVPSTIHLPENLFIIGTINVDETTYMFSPKVLDRANSIEFRTGAEQLASFLRDPSTIRPERLAGRGAGFSDAFLVAATIPTPLTDPALSMLREELLLLFRILADHGYEFGLRTAAEASRFTQGFLLLCSPENAESKTAIMAAVDAQIYQKLLPKLNGTRGRLEPALRSLASFCETPHVWSATTPPVLLNADQLLASARTAAKPRYGGAAVPQAPTGNAPFPLSLDKIERMLRALDHNGFASFAEA
ncbi:MAG: MrcB family domain-containing protein, partial [Thermomicrobiales bacterium]